MDYRDLTVRQMEAIIHKLGGVEGAMRFLAGDRQVVITRHVIDTIQAPHYDYELFSVERHNSVGRRGSSLLEWNSSRITLWRPPSLKQRTIDDVEALVVHKHKVLNATVRDYLLRYQDLIPQDWREKILCFYGTIFSKARAKRFVPTIRWEDGKWENVFYDTSKPFEGNMFVPILQKQK